MSLEHFEKEVKRIFIKKGWASESQDWWVTQVEGWFKNKKVTIKRCNEGHVGFHTSFSQVAPTYEEAFTLMLKRLEK